MGHLGVSEERNGPAHAERNRLHFGGNQKATGANPHPAETGAFFLPLPASSQKTAEKHSFPQRTL